MMLRYPIMKNNHINNYLRALLMHTVHDPCDTLINDSRKWHYATSCYKKRQKLQMISVTILLLDYRSNTWLRDGKGI